MAWAEVALAGGFALAGGSLQQAYSMANRRRADRQARHDEEHAAFVDFAKASRRLQRAMKQRHEAGAAGQSPEADRAVAERANDLAEAVAVVRLVVACNELIEKIEAFEDRAGEICAHRRTREEENLGISPLLDEIREYEERRRPNRSTR